MARRKKLPVGIETHGSGYRCWVSDQGKKTKGPVRPTLAEAKADRARMLRSAPTGRTLEQALELVIRDAKANLTPGTLRYYQSQKNQLLAAFRGATPLHRINQNTVNVFVEKRREDVSAETVRKNLRTLLRAFKLAERSGWCNDTDIPIRHSDITRIRTNPKPPDWFRPHELSKILLTIRRYGATRDADVIEFLFLTGLRRAEAARLTVDDIDLKEPSVRVEGKVGGRVVPLSKSAVAVLGRLSLPAQKLLFPGGVEEIKRACQRWQKSLPEPRLHPHALRHSTGAALAKQHAPAVVARIMGHSILMTMRYFHLAGEEALHAISSLSLPETPAGTESRPNSAPRAETQATEQPPAAQRPTAPASGESC